MRDQSLMHLLWRKEALHRAASWHLNGKLGSCFSPQHRWSHEYQEATIDKIIRFLQGRSSRDSSAGSDNGLDCSPPIMPT